jgi:hypothetical protein
MIVKDVEDLLILTRDTLINFLNDEIDILNSKKPPPVVPHVSSDEFFFFFRHNANSNKFFNIYTEEVPVTTNYDGCSVIPVVVIDVNVKDSQSDDYFTFSLRYLEAIKATILKKIVNEELIENSSDLKILSLDPVQFLTKDTFANTIVSTLKFSVDLV